MRENYPLIDDNILIIAHSAAQTVHGHKELSLQARMEHPAEVRLTAPPTVSTTSPGETARAVGKPGASPGTGKGPCRCGDREKGDHSAAAPCPSTLLGAGLLNPTKCVLGSPGLC